MYTWYFGCLTTTPPLLPQAKHSATSELRPAASFLCIVGCSCVCLPLFVSLAQRATLARRTSLKSRCFINTRTQLRRYAFVTLKQIFLPETQSDAIVFPTENRVHQWSSRPEKDSGSLYQYPWTITKTDIISCRFIFLVVILRSDHDRFNFLKDL